MVLPSLVGFRRAADTILPNRIVEAHEALSIGLVTDVVEDEIRQAAALRKAQSIARGAPKALAAAKRLLWNGVGLSVEACLPEEARTVSDLSATADSREGLSAVIERRKPVFTGD